MDRRGPSAPPPFRGAAASWRRGLPHPRGAPPAASERGWTASSEFRGPGSASEAAQARQHKRGSAGSVGSAENGKRGRRKGKEGTRGDENGRRAQGADTNQISVRFAEIPSHGLHFLAFV